MRIVFHRGLRGSSVDYESNALISIRQYKFFVLLLLLLIAYYLAGLETLDSLQGR